VGSWKTEVRSKKDKKCIMKFSIDLTYSTSEEWINKVLSDFDSFLQDHADCERKASAMAMSFIAKCPDKAEIIPELIETALEELEHFQQVYLLMQERGVQLKPEMPQDMYIKQLMELCRSGRDERLLDRMLLASVIECRGAERFKLIADSIEDEGLKKFYKNLWTSEAKHGNIFVKMALNYNAKELVYKRLEELTVAEGKICSKLPIRAALH
jgi:tRNA-(ms[2]io[6]A)-hydroxylase